MRCELRARGHGSEADLWPCPALCDDQRGARPASWSRRGRGVVEAWSRVEEWSRRRHAARNQKPKRLCGSDRFQGDCERESGTGNYAQGALCFGRGLRFCRQMTRFAGSCQARVAYHHPGRKGLAEGAKGSRVKVIYYIKHPALRGLYTLTRLKPREVRGLAGGVLGYQPILPTLPRRGRSIPFRAFPGFFQVHS